MICAFECHQQRIGVDRSGWIRSVKEVACTAQRKLGLSPTLVAWIALSYCHLRKQTETCLTDMTWTSLGPDQRHQNVVQDSSTVESSRNIKDSQNRNWVGIRSCGNAIDSTKESWFCTVTSTAGRLKFVFEMVGSQMICELHQDNFFFLGFLIEMEYSKLGDSLHLVGIKAGLFEWWFGNCTFEFRWNILWQNYN